MAKTKDLEGFKRRQDSLLDDLPIFKGRRLDETLNSSDYRWISSQSPSYFSWLGRDRCIGLVLEVYGAKRTKGEVKVQKIAVIPEREDVTPLIRNCYYDWSGPYSGFHSYGYTGFGSKWFGYTGEFGFCDEDFPVDRIPCGWSMFDGSVLGNLDPALKWCAYTPNTTNAIGCLEYIRLYRRWPEACERLFKAGLYRFLSEKALAKLEENKGFASWVIRNRESLRDGGMACKTAYDAYRKNPNGDPSDYQRSLMYRVKCGRESAFRNKEVYRKALKFATQERIAEYIRANTNRESYGDYLVACDWLKLDFSDTKVLFPHDFRAMHDLYTVQYAEHLKEAEAARNKAEVETKNRLMKETADRFSFLGDFTKEGFCVVVAASKEELIDEGSTLEHCVGRMDYDRRQAEGRSVICFIRRVGDESTPYVTAEVKVDGQLLKVGQCYGYKDSLVHEVDGFVKGWMEASNKAYRKVRKEST